jgi:hypothetical protein
VRRDWLNPATKILIYDPAPFIPTAGKVLPVTRNVRFHLVECEMAAKTGSRYRRAWGLVFLIADQIIQRKRKSHLSH